MTIAPGRSPGKAWLALAGAAAVAGAALFALFRAPAPPPDPRAAQPPAVASAPPAPPLVEPAPRTPAARDEPDRASPPTRALDEVTSGDPDPADAIAGDVEEEPRERAPSGIALFPPRGTEPVRTGLVVPDGFELPEGFMRHYQVTDDGQELPPILVVHPDFELLDAQGQPVERPEGGVVPPELAPPGLPIETLVVPEPTGESGP